MSLYTRPKKGVGKLREAMLGCLDRKSGHHSLLCWHVACKGELLQWAESPIRSGAFKGCPKGHVVVFHRNHTLRFFKAEEAEKATLLYEACSARADSLTRAKAVARWRRACRAVVCTHRMWRLLERAADHERDLAAETEAFLRTQSLVCTLVGV